MSWGLVPLSAASADFANRADTPIRKAPVTSLISAQRPVSSSASSQRAKRDGSSALPSLASVSTTVVSDISSRP